MSAPADEKGERMISADAQKMKRMLEHYPKPESLRALASEIRSVQCRSYDLYIQARAYPSRRSGIRANTTKIADKTAWLAVDGRERFERDKQRDLKRLVAIYRDTERFLRLAPACVKQLPKHEATLLVRHCVSGEGISAIAADIGLSRATAYRKYDEAVEHFTFQYNKNTVGGTF